MSSLEPREGTCGCIVPGDNPEVVIKKVWKRANAWRRIHSHRAPTQCLIQNWAHMLCRPENGFNILWVPPAWDFSKHQYRMLRIDDSNMLSRDDIDSDIKLENDLKLLYAAGFKSGYYPADFELFRQPDGSVAMVDFDKFGWWREDGAVRFPWTNEWDSKAAAYYRVVDING